MKVWLMNPLSPSRDYEFCDIGLGYLASGLRDAGHEVKLLLRFVTEAEFCRLLREEKPGIVGIKVLTSYVHEAARTVKIIRRAFCRSLIAIGGPHVSGDPAGVLNQIPADYGFQGEADLSFPKFVNRVAAHAPAEERERVPGLIFRKNGGVVANPPEVIGDLDALPFPAWDLMPPGEYPSLVRRRSPAAALMTARGCSYGCVFCAEALSRFRRRSVKNVMEEIHYLVDRFNVREIHFLDSNVLARKEYVTELCHRILEDGLSLSFSAPNGVRLEEADDELCALLARTGFYRFNVGIESGSPEVLARIRKRASLDLLRERVALMRKHGIQVVGNFMLGFPGETREQLKQTLELALSLDLIFANFSIYVPMPGTRLYSELVREGKLPAHPDFRDHNYVAYENRFSELSPAELRRFRNRCFLRFALRGKTVRSLYELFRSGMQWGSMFQRLYWIYIAKFMG